MKNRTKLTLSTCLAFTLSSAVQSSAVQSSAEVDQGFEIGTVPVTRMVGMIRDNQLATKNQQHWLLQKLTQACKEDSDTSGATFGKELSERLQNNILALKESGITSQSYDNVGIPIRHHKTLIQLEIADSWVREQGDNFGPTHFNYKGLLGDLSNSLPELGSNPITSFWGNGNDAVSGIFLYTVVKYYESKDMLSGIDLSKGTFPGAATFFPFYNSNFECQCTDNDFLFPNGMLLAGDYQYGGRRYWSDQLPFGPEDCSSAVVKATLDGNEFTHLTTRSFREMYSNPKYRYEAITTSEKKDLELELIKPGDIYVKGGHTAIITAQNNGVIETIEFNRDIDSDGVKKATVNPRMGGGTFSYNLTVTDPKMPIYIFRKPDTQLSESVSLNTLLARIDANFITNHLNDENRSVMVK